MAKRKAPHRTVKGRDIELDANDRRMDTSGQMPFTNPRQPPKEGTLGALIARTPFGKAAKVLRD